MTRRLGGEALVAARQRPDPGELTGPPLTAVRPAAGGRWKAHELPAQVFVFAQIFPGICGIASRHLLQAMDRATTTNIGSLMM